MRRVGLPLALVSCLTLGACAESPIDNCEAADRDITLGNLFNNTVNRRYDACLADLQQELDSLRLDANVLSLRAQALRTQAARLGGAGQAQARRLADIHEEQAELMRRLAAASTEQTVNEAELRALLDRQEALREQLRTGTPTGTDAAVLAALEREQEALSRRILRLTGT
ncbi:MAG: hypothetical protein GDA36_09970 [Rhodobacteraceae bacterium]|nr:hypothetical protein [Paracoccaceae bacterium]